MRKEFIKEIEKEKNKITYKVLFLNMLFDSENALIFKNNTYMVKKNDLINKYSLFKGFYLNRKVYKGESI